MAAGMDMVVVLGISYALRPYLHQRLYPNLKPSYD